MPTTTQPPVEFKQKVKYIDDRPYITFPAEWKRTHCDMAAFRDSGIYGTVANSTMFLGAMKRGMENLGVVTGSWHYLDDLPPGVSVDTSGFLATVRIDLPLEGRKPWAYSVRFQVRAYGNVHGTLAIERKAIEFATDYPAEAWAQVIRHERKENGQESWQVIWPVAGEPTDKQF